MYKIYDHGYDDDMMMIMLMTVIIMIMIIIYQSSMICCGLGSVGALPSDLVDHSNLFKLATHNIIGYSCPIPSLLIAEFN